MNLLTVFARREPTTDDVARRYMPARQLARCRDTVIYRDRACRRFFCRIPWHYRANPRRNTRFITLNCFRWRLVHLGASA